LPRRDVRACRGLDLMQIAYRRGERCPVGTARRDAGVRLTEVPEWLPASLRRMGIETIDLYHLHRADLLMDPAEVAGVEWMSFDDIMAHPKTPVWIRQSLRLAAALKRELYPET